MPSPSLDPVHKSSPDPPRRPPRAVSLRGVLIAVAVLGFALAMALASISMRRTQLEKTTDLYGAPTIHALQWGRTMRVVQGEAEAVDLSGVPGLGHFRHALLDDRHYDWPSLRDRPVSEVAANAEALVVLELDGPPESVEPVAIWVDMETGWVGPVEGARAVRLTPRVAGAVTNFLRTTATVRDRPAR
jgi:hypothetical protein